MPEYRIGVSLEECVQITIEADTAKQAEHLAFDLVEREGGTSYPKEYSPSHSHRDYVVAVISKKRSMPCVCADCERRANANV